MTGEFINPTQPKTEQQLREALTGLDNALANLREAQLNYMDATGAADAALKEHLLGRSIHVKEGLIDKVCARDAQSGWMAVDPEEAGISAELSDQQIAVTGVSIEVSERPGSSIKDPAPYLSGTLVGGAGDGTEIRLWLDGCDWAILPGSPKQNF